MLIFASEWHRCESVILAFIFKVKMQMITKLSLQTLTFYMPIGDAFNLLVTAAVARSICTGRLWPRLVDPVRLSIIERLPGSAALHRGLCPTGMGAHTPESTNRHRLREQDLQRRLSHAIPHLGPGLWKHYVRSVADVDWGRQRSMHLPWRGRHLTAGRRSIFRHTESSQANRRETQVTAEWTACTWHQLYSDAVENAPPLYAPVF